MKTVTAVVCAYTAERWSQLVDALDSLTGQTRVPDEIVVVVDHNDDLLRRVKQDFADARVVPNEARRGLSGARNTGIAVATSDLVVFVDDDAVAKDDLVERLVDEFADEQVQVVGGAAVPRWQARRPTWFPEEFDWVIGCSYRGMPTASAEVRNVFGCNMAFRRDVFTHVGGFLDEMGRIGSTPTTSCDETELCLRIAATYGPRAVRYQPAARVDHFVPDTRCTVSYFVRRCYAEGWAKALISEVHSAESLGTEWRYTTRVLPAGVARGVMDIFRGRPAGFLRAVAIFAGLGVTTVGYLQGRVRVKVLGGLSEPPLASRSLPDLDEGA